MTTSSVRNNTTWILVARRDGAQVFRGVGRGLPLQLVHQVEHPAGRLRASDVNADRAGSSHDRMGHFSHAMSSEQGPTERIDREFASQLATLVDRGRQQAEYGQLALVAPPRLLGYLREAMPEPTRRLVTAELAKDLIDPSDEELRKQLADQLLV